MRASSPSVRSVDRLAAGVGTRDDERRVAVAEADVDGDDPPGQPGMARREEDDLLARRRSPARIAVHLRRELRLRDPEVELRERVERLAQQRRVRGDERATARRGSGSTSSSTAACASRHALPSSTTTSGSTNSVWPLPDASWTMPLTCDSGLGTDRHDVAAVAERDDRLLERAAELRADERVQPAAEPVVGDPDGARAGRRVAATRCRAARRRGRSCGRACSAAPAAGGLRVRARAAAAGAPRRGASRGGPRRRGSRRSRGTAARRGGRRAPRGRSTGRCRARPRCPTPAAPGAAAAPGRSRRGARATITGSAEGSSSSASRRDGSNEVFSARRARTCGNSRSAIERASMRRGQGPAGRSSDGLPATASRHGTRAHGSPA